MPEIHLTPEQERAAQRAFENRKFDPDSYEKDLLGPEAPPAVQVEVAEMEMREYEERTSPTSAALEELARQKELSEADAAPFNFLDPRDYEDKAARVGRILHCRDLLRMLQTGCELECWYSLADEGMIAREPNIRDIGLAYRKIAGNKENINDADRWSAAIKEIQQERDRKQPMHLDTRFGLQVCRQPGKPEYCTWVPACHMTEFGDVAFDSHGTPVAEARGWRTVLMQLIFKQFITEEQANKVFKPAEGPGARRYNLILSGLRNQPAGARATEAPLEIKSSQNDIQPTPEPEAPAAVVAMPDQNGASDDSAPDAPACSECGRRGGFGHYSGCSKFEAWLKGENENG